MSFEQELQYDAKDAASDDHCSGARPFEHHAGFSHSFSVSSLSVIFLIIASNVLFVLHLNIANGHHYGQYRLVCCAASNGIIVRKVEAITGILGSAWFSQTTCRFV